MNVKYRNSLLLLAAYAVCISHGLASENPYSSISKRNIFGLVPITVTNTPVEVPKLPTISLHGITTILGKKQVIFRLKDPKTSKDESFLLAEGETEQGVKVITVDIKEALALFDNHGTTQKILLSAVTSSTDAKPAQGAANSASVAMVPLPVNNPNPENLSPEEFVIKQAQQLAAADEQRAITRSAMRNPSGPERTAVNQVRAEDASLLIPPPPKPRPRFLKTN